MWQTLEPLHALTYFAPETRAETEALGLRGGWMAYFGCRAAALGAVPPAVVTATFYGFHPRMVARAIPDAWSHAAPEQLLAARRRAVDAALRRLLGQHCAGPEVAEAAELARAAAAAAPTAGRPLGAAHAALDWPAEPHLVLWQACTVLRESRGDGHVAALVTADIGPCESHILLSAAGGPTATLLRSNRGWSDEEWAAAVVGLQRRGWVDPTGQLSEAGRAARDGVEARTDELSAAPWAALGEAQTARLSALGAALSGAVFEAGGLPLPNPMGLQPVR
ncbi:MAG: hypothetical protein ABJA34_02450 [Pseudonocardiales bacterium]